MANPIIKWTKNTSSGFFVNVSGNLTSAGNVWSGDMTSPSQKWKISFPAVTITGGPNVESPWKPDYHLSFDRINGQQLQTGVTFNSGGGYSANSPSLPWGSGITGGFMFNNVASPASCAGRFYMTFTWASNLQDFTSWRYSIDIEVSGAAPA